ncbi:MAG: hypothetical protein FWC00_04010 [Firmicutes bacterium]|nr:hypothetical protein [Bacillota bacterium]
MKAIIIAGICLLIFFGALFGGLWAAGVFERGPTYVDAMAPNITTQPTAQTVDVGAVVTLSVTATSPDGGSLSFQWFRNSFNDTVGATKIQDATNATLNPNTQTAGTVFFFVVVTNTNTTVNGAQTAYATSNVVPVSVQQVVNITIEGGTVRLLVANDDTAVESGEFRSGQIVVITPVDLVNFLYFTNNANNTVFAWRHQLIEQNGVARTFTHMVTGDLNLRAVGHENVIGLGVVGQPTLQPNDRIQQFNQAPIALNNHGGLMHSVRMGFLTDPNHTGNLSAGVMSMGTWVGPGHGEWSESGLGGVIAPTFSGQTVEFELLGGSERYVLYLIVFVPELNTNMAFITNPNNHAEATGPIGPGWTIPRPPVLAPGVMVTYTFTNANGQTFILNSRAN